MSQSTAWRGHSKSLSEKLSASFWREIIWKWGEGHLWNEVRLHLKEKKKKRGITRSVCDLSKARRSPRPQWWGRGDPKIDSTSVAGFPTVIPSIWSFISMLCWAHPTLLCMQWRFRTRPQISCAASPPGSRGRRIHLQENIIICDLAWDHLSPIVCTQSQGNFFPPHMHAAYSGRKKRIWFGPSWCYRVIYQPNALSPLGVRCEYFQVVPLRGSSFMVLEVRPESESSLFIFHKYGERTHAVQPNLLF